MPYQDRKSTRLNSSHTLISYAVFCLKKKKNTKNHTRQATQPGSDEDATGGLCPHSTMPHLCPNTTLLLPWRVAFSMFFFFFNDTATTEIYTLSLHHALPICLNSSHTLISYAVFCLRDESVTGVQ